MATVGMIGLGLMGLPIAQHLLEAGYGVAGFRRSEAKDFIAMGGELLKSPRHVIEAADVVLCCIPSDVALRDVVSGPQGLIRGDCTGKILVELSTLSERTKSEEAEKLARSGGTMLDGAISGLPPMVKSKSAVYFLSGDEKAYERSRPVLETLTTKLCFMGDFGAASKTKLCANMLVAVNLAAIAETLTFGAKQGLDIGRLVAALADGAGSSVQFQARAGRMATGDWEVALGTTATLAKDVELIAAAAKESECPIPVLAGVQSVYETALRDGYGGSDVASIYGSVAHRAGLPVPDRNGDAGHGE